jgi:hypothetical protein
VELETHKMSRRSQPLLTKSERESRELKIDHLLLSNLKSMERFNQCGGRFFFSRTVVANEERLPAPARLPN